MRSKPKATYLEESRGTYLFTKRLSQDKGDFPGRSDKFKRRIGSTASMTKAEALTTAARLSTELEHLQTVCLRDAKGLDNSSKDLSKAAQTLLWVWEIDLEDLRTEKTKFTKEALRNREGLEEIVSIVISFFEHHEARPSHPDGDLRYLTPFGDHLLAILRTGTRFAAFSDALEAYLKHTNREHLPETNKTVKFSKTVLNRFTQIAGDKQLESISRRDVEKYIQQRLEVVKTTTVAREINSLRSIWNKASKANDIRSQNPFSEQPIKGLGTDATKRETPTIEESRQLLQLLSEKKASTYVAPMLAIAVLTGLRVSEAAMLVEADWNRAAGVLNIQSNERRSRLKTENSYRPFPVLPQLEFWLEAFFRQTPPASGTSASTSGIKKLKKLGFGHLKNHSFRHGFKQRLVEVDTPDNLIDELMGWSSQGMRRNYGFVTVTEKKRSAVSAAYQALDQTPKDEKVVYLNSRRN